MTRGSPGTKPSACRQAAEADTIRLAMGRLARRYAPDQGGTERQRAWVNAAGAQAKTTAEDRAPSGDTRPPRP
jgi:hypothetical protein